MLGNIDEEHGKNRFLLFAGAAYYPVGMSDLVGGFSDVNAADQAGLDLTTQDEQRLYLRAEEWYRVLDTETLEVVREFGRHYGDR